MLTDSMRAGPRALGLFVDVDGTLLEIADTPLSVRVDVELGKLLQALRDSTTGALALVSGRGIAEMDELFVPLVLPAAGLHGYERRDATGSWYRGTAPAPAVLGRVRERMGHLAKQHPGLFVEDKRFALALHYRRAPHLAGLVAGAMAQIAEDARPEFELQLGKMVAELRPAGSNKGAAVGAFMLEEPFRGRLPIYIGDDLTDESAFEWVNGAGGLSIAVGVTGPSAAKFRLPGVAAVRQWLAHLHGDSIAALDALRAPTVRVSPDSRTW